MTVCIRDKRIFTVGCIMFGCAAPQCLEYFFITHSTAQVFDSFLRYAILIKLSISLKCLMDAKKMVTFTMHNSFNPHLCVPLITYPFFFFQVLCFPSIMHYMLNALYVGFHMFHRFCFLLFVSCCLIILHLHTTLWICDKMFLRTQSVAFAQWENIIFGLLG